MIRSKQSELKTVVLHDLSESQSAQLNDVSWDDCNVWFTIKTDGEMQSWRYCYSTCEVTLLSC
ncbi:hypothetical protein JCM19233_4205 [Vibrio astriarenae]|nr:hypothetical protein JCM19233_4205 [Vibrio sp. C7]